MAKNVPRPYRAERHHNKLAGSERPPAKPGAKPSQLFDYANIDYIDELMSAMSRVETRLTSIADRLDGDLPNHRASDPSPGIDQSHGLENSNLPQPAAAGSAPNAEGDLGHLVRGFRTISAGNRRIDGAADELTSVIETTEQATEEILSACEAIDETAGDVSQQLLNIEEAEHLVPAVASIRDEVVRIFQASSFQDLTGQRLSNVTQILASVETRLQDVERVMGIEADETADDGPAANCTDPSDKHFDESGLLNGPDADGISQDDIDKLFG